MQVIDIPSSPEPSASSMTRPARSASNQSGPSSKRRRVLREPSIVELIELTDSDNDPSPTPTMMTNAIPLFGKPNLKILPGTRAPAPGSSQRGQHRERQDGVRLFLPSDDEAERSLHPSLVPASQNGSTVAPSHPHPPPLDQAVRREPVHVNPTDEYIVRVLEIVPDVEPTHASTLIEQFMRSHSGNVVELVLHSLFENPTYPKVDRKGKRKCFESDDGPNDRGTPKPKVDYTSKERVYSCGPHYFECSLEQLTTDFPRIPKPHLRARLQENRFYAPTYLLLAEELKMVPPPFKLKISKSTSGKGKARHDPEFDKEREWVLLKVAELETRQDAVLAASINEQEYEENGDSIQCGCCFSGYPFDEMIQCPEAHLFCKSCMTTYVSTLLGEHNPNIVCMDQSGCKFPFPDSELTRFLSSKLLDLYYRVKQRKEIEAAGLENLEECPFCEYKCVIENKMEKLFRCENASCSAVTCRGCKKPDHLPRSCQEVEDDKQLNAQHVVEEAMTQALMRNCPKCQKSFIKETGCNKMTCPNCHTVSCYICRQVISGYEHFSDSFHPRKEDKSKCNLWDPVEKRHAQEVSEAAKRALADLQKSRPDVDAAQLKVDIPPVQPPPRTRAAPALDGHLLPRVFAPMAEPVRFLGMEYAPPLHPEFARMRNPFVFGAGQEHIFVPPVYGLGMPPPGLVAPPIPAAQAMPGVRVRGRPAALAPPPIPAAQVMPGIRARGRPAVLAPPPLLGLGTAPVAAPVPAQPAMVAGGQDGRRRRR